MVSFILNGSEVTVADDHPHLLAALREELGVCSPKDGCSPSGQCGCCTVLVDGKAVVSCNLSVQKVAGTTITTLEGLPDDERERMASAFAATGALQCGFCTPGILVRVAALLERKGADLDRDTAARHLGAHLCRCTGYVKILDAVELLAKGETPELQPLGGIGSSGSRYQGFDLALGDKPYVDDLRPPGMLHGAVRLADHARADVLRIDTTAARPVPGVVRVLTAADVPGELRVGLIHKDWPVFIPEGGRTSYLGDVLAFVVADDRDTGATRRRARRGRVPRAANAHRSRRRPRPTTRTRCGSSTATCCRAPHTRAATSTRRSRRARTSCTRSSRPSASSTRSSSPSRPSSCPSPAVGSRCTPAARACGTTATRPRRCSASTRNGSPPCSSRTAVRSAARRTWRTRRRPRWPRSCSTRRSSARCRARSRCFIHPKRHPIRIDLTVGCDADGRLTALRARMVGDSGPYASVGMKVLERAAGHASGPYHLPAIDVEAFAARTNNSVCGAFRGFGANQAQFAMEGALDRLAEQVGISGWEIRRRNVIKPGEVWGPGQIMDDGCRGAQRCLEAVKPAYDAAIAAGRAVGLGLGLKNSGLGNGFLEIVRAVVRFEPDGTVEVRHCWTEMGQGVHTVAAQVAIEELGVDPARVRVIVDTTRELGAGQTTGSRGTLMGAGAVADACRAARADGCRVGVDYAGEYRVDWTSSIDVRRRAAGDPFRVRVRGAARRRRSRDRRDRAGRRRARRRARGEPDAVRRPDRGLGAHGPRLRAHRGLPVRRGRPADADDPARARHHPGQGRSADRGDPRRGAAAACALRDQGRRRDRARADGRRGRGGAARPRRRMARGAADAPMR